MQSRTKKACYLPETLSFLPQLIPVPGDLVQCLPLGEAPYLQLKMMCFSLAESLFKWLT